MAEVPAPEWFTRAVETPYRERWLPVSGTDIHYLEWGEQGLPGLVFVHGGAAHAHWWSFLAPMFAKRWHAVALDLSGHGDSGRRDRYDHRLWAEEVVAVADARPRVTRRSQRAGVQDTRHLPGRGDGDRALSPHPPATV